MANFLNEHKFPKQTAIVKVFLFWFIFILLLMAAGLFNNMAMPFKWHHLSYGILGTLGAVTATFILLKVERKSFADYGLQWQRKTLSNFLKGFVIGAVCFAIMFLVLITTTSLTIEVTNKHFGIDTCLTLLSVFFMAYMEEMAFRAYPFWVLNKTVGLRGTQILIAIVFALYHIVQGWNVEVSFLGPGIWALVFGLGAYYSKGIALPTGIHMALNVSQDLMGTKGNNQQAFYILKQQDNSDLAIAHTQTIGLVIQLLVLAVALVLTEWYIRKLKPAA